ncbi:MAG: hypothetical protein ACO31W_04650 [Gemmatimonadaceae bacterium]
MPLFPVAILAFQLVVALPADSGARAPVPSAAAEAGAPLPASRFGARPALPAPRLDEGRALPPLPVGQDSVPEYSAWYYRRLDVHRWGSYAMLPLFAYQYWAGTQLMRGDDEGEGVEDGHELAATGVATLFTVNTVTGLWNLYEGWNDPTDRTRKRLHAILLLAADAGFLATGLLAEEADDSGRARRTHRTVAIGSMALATSGWLMMLDLFR